MYFLYQKAGFHHTDISILQIFHVYVIYTSQIFLGASKSDCSILKYYMYIKLQLGFSLVAVVQQ